MNKRIAILGATGYTGQEVLKLVRRHPGLDPLLVMNARPGVAPPPPALSYDPVVEACDPSRLADVDGVFLCTPHGAAGDLAVPPRSCVARRSTA